MLLAEILQGLEQVVALGEAAHKTASRPGRDSQHGFSFLAVGLVGKL
jgi:hypothetical protein